MKKERNEMLTIEAMDLQKINDAIEVLRKGLEPYLSEATMEEKKSLAKMKDKSFAFVIKAYEHGVKHPDLVPAFVDIKVLQNHIDGLELLRQLSAPLKVLMKGIEDTSILIGSDAYNSALAIYGAAKVASKNNVTGAQVVYEDLSIRFAHNGKGNAKEGNNEAA